MHVLALSLSILAGTPPALPAGLEWAEVLEAKPDAAVVTDAALRGAIEATGLPWRVRDRASGIELLLVPPGKFLRGAGAEDADAEASEKPQREVELSAPFYLGRYEVTWAQWRGVMGIDPVVPQVDPRQPAWNMSHADIQRFAACTGLRLPSEAEWERACRAGSGELRYGALNDCAWSFRNSGKLAPDAEVDWDLELARKEWRCKAQPVGGKRANALGFHDMLGNVSERCADWYSEGEYARADAALLDPRGPAAGRDHVVRGGSFDGPEWSCRASQRDYVSPSRRDTSLGFRAARDARPAANRTRRPIAKEQVESWGEILEEYPDPAVVTDLELRTALEQAGLPWRVKDKATGIELLLVPATRYLRGASELDYRADANEKPQHEVELSRAFYLGRFEVTQAQWELVMGSNPATKARKPDYPVENISLEMARGFRARTGLRVPTEAEWELACRAGTLGAWYGPIDDIAWNADNSELTTHAVGGKRANALGFHDMLGNVYEWCSDPYAADAYAQLGQLAKDPTGPGSGNLGVIRGGSCHYDDAICRAPRRGTFRPTSCLDDFGLRVARTPGVDLPPAAR